METRSMSSQRTIIVPVDGATNIKLEVLDFESFETLSSESVSSPVEDRNGMLYNATNTEFEWFAQTIRRLPEPLRTDIAAIAPVARGCSGGFVDADNRLCEIPGCGLTLSYSHRYPEHVEERFGELAGAEDVFYKETGSILTFPGSLTLLKRFVFEQMERPELLERSAAFGYYGALMSGYFLDADYVGVAAVAGNEHSYWMCHTGARNVRETAGTPSRVSQRLQSFVRLVPSRPAVAYRAIGTVPLPQAKALGAGGRLLVVPGGHDTCLSHIPVMATFRQAFPDRSDRSVLRVEGGTWTMIAQLGGNARLPDDGYRRDILVQGTVDGDPVVTARYGGGNDFRHVQKLVDDHGKEFGSSGDDQALTGVLAAADVFVLPNISPFNHGTGPFPEVRGRVVNEQAFSANGARAAAVASLTTAISTAAQVTAIAESADVPIVITAGASKDPHFGRLLATLTGREVYAMRDRNGNAVTETTTVGAAVCGKAACSGCHPYDVDLSGLGVTFESVPPYVGAEADGIARYRKRLLQLVASG